MKSALIVDDHPMIQIGCSQMLNAAGVAKTWTADDLAVAKDAAGEHQPDLIVLDVSLPHGNGLEAIEGLRAAAPKAMVLVFTMNDRPVFARRALDAGANGFLSKNAPPSSFRDAVATLKDGGTYLDHSLALEVISLQSRNETWTPRERAMLQGLANGQNLSQIADQQQVSYKTIANLSSALKKKTGADSLAALIQFAVRGTWKTEGIFAQD